MKKIPMFKFVVVAILLLVLPLSSIMAQKMKIESFVKLSQAEDPDARDVTFGLKDNQSGRSGLCAIIKIVTSVQDQNFTFDLGADLTPEMVSYKKEDGEIWVYVPAGTNKIKISHSKLGQLDTRDGYYDFRSAGITKCEAATVYRLKLHADYNPDGIIVTDPNKSATVEIRVTPARANVTIGSRIAPTNVDGKDIESLKLGIYPFRVSSENYHDFDGQFELKNEGEKVIVYVSMKPAFGWAQLPADFNTDDCRFTVNNHPCQIQGNKVVIPSGTHKVYIEKTGYYPREMEVTVQDSTITEINPYMEAVMGKLQVSAPQGTTVTVDGKYIGTTPFAAKDIIVGRHKVEFTRPNTIPETREVRISEGKTENVTVNLSNKNSFYISSNPTGASLYIDGKYIGTTPCTTSSLQSGKYHFRLNYYGYKPYDKNVQLDATNPSKHIKMTEQYQKKKMGYLEGAFGIGNSMAVSGLIGGYAGNFNMEAGYNYVFGTDIYWGGFIKEPIHAHTLTVRLGYGIIAGARMRITPQIGCAYSMIRGEEETKTFNIALTVGARIECAIVKHFGISLTPEYDIPVKKGGLYEKMVDNDIKNIVNGFSARVGFYLFY